MKAYDELIQDNILGKMSNYIEDNGTDSIRADFDDDSVYEQTANEYLRKFLTSINVEVNEDDFQDLRSDFDYFLSDLI